MPAYQNSDYSRAMFVGNLNVLRKASKGAWVFESGTIGGVEYSYKAYNTWVQRLTVGGVIFDSPADCSVEVFLDALRRAFEYAAAKSN